MISETNIIISFYLESQDLQGIMRQVNYETTHCNDIQREEARKIKHWSPEALYKPFSKKCFTKTSEGRANFSEVVAMIEKNLLPEEIRAYTERSRMYQSYYVENYFRFSSSHNRFLSILTLAHSCSKMKFLKEENFRKFFKSYTISKGHFML